LILAHGFVLTPLPKQKSKFLPNPDPHRRHSLQVDARPAVSAQFDYQIGNQGQWRHFLKAIITAMKKRRVNDGMYGSAEAVINEVMELLKEVEAIILSDAILRSSRRCVICGVLRSPHDYCRRRMGFCYTLSRYICNP
jgi:hypothetical protein